MVAENGHGRSGLKAASANQKAYATFWGPQRLITRPCPAAAHCKTEAARQKIDVTLLQHSFLL